MRVLHLSAGKLYGGIESMLVTLARHRDLCPAMVPRFALCFEGRLGAELAESGTPAEILGDVRVSRYWTVLLARRRLARLLERTRPDVVVCHEAWPYALFAPVVRERRIPLVFWAHGLHAGRDWLDRWAGRTSPDLVVSNSHATASTLKSLFPEGRSGVVYCPVLARGPADPEASRRILRAELGAPPGAVVIVQVSRLERPKGHSVLLGALARIVDTPTWVAWIVGGAQRPSERAYMAELQESAQRLGITNRVRFLGQRADVPDLLAAADIHCHPSTGPEGFGIAFIEAMLAGLPIVTTAIGAAPEIVDERTGVLLPKDDAVALSEALRRLIVDPEERSRLGAGGPPRARLLSDPAAQLAKLAWELGTLTDGLVRPASLDGSF